MPSAINPGGAGSSSALRRDAARWSRFFPILEGDIYARVIFYRSRITKRSFLSPKYLVENQLAVGGEWFAAGSVREEHAGRKQKNSPLASFFLAAIKEPVMSVLHTVLSGR